MRPQIRAPGRLLLALAILAIALAVPPPAWSNEKPHLKCRCQTMGGWLLFPDSSPRTPDFWWQEEVVVQEILICPHGVQFRFMAEERGNPYLVSLLFTVAPASWWPTYRDPARSRQALAALEAKVSELFAGTFRDTGRLDFRRLPEAERPRILEPSRRLALVWQGQEVELRGYLDVYMTLLI